MRVLVTNDDGIDAPGMLLLAQALNDHHDVFVVAPRADESGAGPTLRAQVGQDIAVRTANLSGIEHSWSVDASPAMCVLLAGLGGFGAAPDLVVSGVNPGHNLGWTIGQSGTVGAALFASAVGLGAIAISSRPDQLGEAAAFASAIVNTYGGVDMRHTPALNINVSTTSSGAFDWQWTTASVTPPPRLLTLDPAHTNGSVLVNFQLAFTESPDAGLDAEEGSDRKCVEAGRTSLTWLSPLGAILSDTARRSQETIDQRLRLSLGAR